MKRIKNKYHGKTKEQFLIHCASKVILQVPPEQDYLLVEYCEEIGGAIANYIRHTNKDNLEMIYRNEFKFTMNFNEQVRICHMKFDYFH